MHFDCKLRLQLQLSFGNDFKFKIQKSKQDSSISKKKYKLKNVILKDGVECIKNQFMRKYVKNPYLHLFMF